MIKHLVIFSDENRYVVLKYPFKDAVELMEPTYLAMLIA